MLYSILGQSVVAARADIAQSRLAFGVCCLLWGDRHSVGDTISVSFTASMPDSAFTTAMEFVVEPSLESCDVLLGHDFKQSLRYCPFECWMSVDEYAANCDDFPLPLLPSTVELRRSPNGQEAVPSRMNTGRGVSFDYPHNHNPIIPNGDEQPGPSTTVSQWHSGNDLNTGREALRESLLGRRRFGSLLCPFITNVTGPDLCHSLFLHGIDSAGLSVLHMREALLCHLASGDCFGVLPHSDRSGCRVVNRGFPGSDSISEVALELLATASEHQRSTDELLFFFQAAGVRTDFRPHRVRAQCLSKIHHIKASVFYTKQSLPPSTFIDYEHANRGVLVTLASRHRLSLQRYTDSTDEIRQNLAYHFVSGNCLKVCNTTTSNSDAQSCSSTVRDTSGESSSQEEFALNWLTDHLGSFGRVTLRRIFPLLGIQFTDDDSASSMRKTLRKFIADKRNANITCDADLNARLADIYSRWPPVIPMSMKDRILLNFRQATSSEALRTSVCASCSESVSVRSIKRIKHTDLDLRVFLAPNVRVKPSTVEGSPVEVVDSDWLSGANSDIPMTHSIPGMDNVLLDNRGVSVEPGESEYWLDLCPSCHSDAINSRVPPLSLANHNYLGPVPSVLQELTVVEESMIAKCRSKCWVLHLKEDSANFALPNAQRGLKGHVIIYPQKAAGLSRVLPPTVEDSCTPICVIFVGSSKPSDAWLRSKAKPLIVRREKVRAALLWLKANNPLYADVEVSQSNLDALPENAPLPVHIEHVDAEHQAESLTSRYDSYNLDDYPNESRSQPEPTFENVVVTDVDVTANSTELEAAAMRHFKQKGQGYLQVGHEPKLVNEFMNPTLFPSVYPTLFPYGIGGFDQFKRSVPLTMKRQSKHLFSLNEPRFQQHHSFLFTVFNVLQRRELLLHTALKVRKQSFGRVANTLAAITPECIHTVSERVSRGDSTTYRTAEEKQVLQLLKEVNVVTSHVPGSSSARVAMRNEIRSLMLEKGLPTFYITINPADVYNPIVRFLAGENIDVDSVITDHSFNYWEQSLLVANNPTLGARFFDVYMKAFINTILRYDPSLRDLDGGIFGLVNGYYGCVEAQGRGTLHCHMMVWVEGSLNCDQIKQRVHGDGDHEFARRLCHYLDDCIATAVPRTQGNNVPVAPENGDQDRHIHPCATRGINREQWGADDLAAKQAEDLRRLVERCQRHKHTATCYKYWKGPLSGEPRLCRFDLDENNIIPETHFDADTGDIIPRHLDGLVNNFNETIIAAIRCNMDLKFISSGLSAKAVIYYITDYITKSQLKAHVAYAALDLAIQKLNDHLPDECDSVTKAKRLLQRCAYTMISHQELSAPQVASYLLDIPDHYVSHEFVPFFWTSLESFIDGALHSPECYPQLGNDIDPTDGPSRSTDNPMAASVSNPDVQEHSHSDLASSSTTTVPSLDHESEDRSLPTVGTSSTDAITDSTHIDRVSLPSDDSVPVSITAQGELLRKIDCVEDYKSRALSLSNISLWDSIAQFEKVKRQSQSTLQLPLALVDAEEAMQNTQLRNCATFAFTLEHPEHDTKVFRLRNRFTRKIPTVIGPALPRRDNPALKSKYCRLMLAFFKPWRTGNDLKLSSQSWEDSFQAFYEHNASARHKKIMENMHLLHECRDSRDDHFIHRRSRPTHSGAAAGSLSNENSDQLMAESEVLDHLLKTDRYYSHINAALSDDVQKCVQASVDAGLFPQYTGSTNSVSMEDDSTENITNQEGLTLEQCWKGAYEDRNKQWKTSQLEAAQAVADASNELENSANTDNWPTVQMNVDHDELSSQSNDTDEFTPSIQPGIAHEVAYVDVDIDEVISEFSLNEEQSKAFRIIASHSLEENVDPLRMYIAGPGGTGKSRVILALKSFFDRRNQSRRFRLSSFTGIAAKNISGMTLHTALSLNQRRKTGLSAKARSDLMKLWVGVDYLFIDEVSMIGARLLLRIHEALVDAKSNNAPFGGINIIFAGDFAQLPPVADNRVYFHPSLAEVSTSADMALVFAKLLWLSVRTVVILTKVMRQNESTDMRFMQLLGRLREGKCTEDDYALLNTRILTRQPQAVDAENIPVIVATNECKDALNSRAVYSFATRIGRNANWYHAQDKWAAQNVGMAEFKEYLLDLPSSKTGQRMGRLPLVVGMPVMLATNFDVEHGIVNGCTGTLRKIRYVAEPDGTRHAVSCIIETGTMVGPAIQGLPEYHAVALEDTTSLRFTHPSSKKSCTIKRTQIPLSPAFAMTTHKAQGQTMGKTIIDLQSCTGTEAPYVMVSRVRTLNDLYILRPFEKKKIQCRQSEDTRREMNRLQLLKLETDLQHGSSHDIERANAVLDTVRLPESNIHHIDLNDQNSARISLSQCQTLQSAFESLTAELSIENDSSDVVLGKRKR